MTQKKKKSYQYCALEQLFNKHLEKYTDAQLDKANALFQCNGKAFK